MDKPLHFLEMMIAQSEVAIKALMPKVLERKEEKTMGRIRLIGLDLDGTLLDNRKQISRRTLAAMEQAAKAGVYLVPVTGRPHEGIPRIVRELPFVRYLISCNGASIRDEQEGEIVRERLIPKDESLALVALLEEKTLPFEVLVGGVGYAQDWVYEHMVARSPFNAFLPNYIKQTRRTVPELSAFIAEGRAVEEFFIMASTEDDIQELAVTLRSHPHLHVVHPALGALEITAAGVDKGEALLHLAAQLEIQQEEVMAIGDSGNDLAMLEAAGMAVAMGNAVPAVKRLSGFVTESNENHGVAVAIERFVLC